MTRNLRNIEGMTKEDLVPDYKYYAKILTKNTDLPSLSALDAGDVVECYALTRMAKLENGDSSSPFNLLVRKSAIAFRYKPKSSSPDAVVKEPFELTLEYGPQRTGSTQSFEAMPSVNGHLRDLEYEDGDGMYVSWENHAKIYYSLQISEEDWDGAHYMAPITGAVLEKVLNDYIMDYPNLHPRYQPFVVVEKSSGKQVLNSSNSDDFVWNVFRKLADMFVAIDPILAPKRYALEFKVEDVDRDVVRLDSHLVMASNEIESSNGEKYERKQNVANFAAGFYHKLYSCVEAVKTGDYSAYEKTDSPTTKPSLSPKSAPTVSSTDAPTSAVTSAETEDEDLNNALNQTDTLDEDSNDDGSDDGNTSGLRMMKSRAGTVDEKLEIIEAELDMDEPETKEDIDTNVLPFVEDANEAAEEAEKAAEAAKEAASSVEDTKAAEAAEAAAEAAKKAAKATSEAANEAAIESLLSGDGELMMNVLQPCFADPKYGISEPGEDDNDFDELSNGTGGKTGYKTTNAYLYVDGSHYYRLNLTSPFVSIVESTRPLPVANLVPNGKGDVIDIGLALAIIGGFCFGIIVMLHHIRVLDWDNRLQFKWFFHPTSKPNTKRGGYSNTPMREAFDDDSLGESNDDVELPTR